MRRFLVFFFAALMTWASVSALALKSAPSYPDRYWKMDTHGSTRTLPSKFRTTLGDFGEGAEEPLPSRKGMDVLSISGSAQYNAAQFAAMISEIRSVTDATICVFDLRQETHGFVNGEAVSLYADGNRGNVGHGTKEVLMIEEKQLSELLNTELTFGSKGSGGMQKPGKKKKTPAPETGMTQTVTMEVTEVMTEAELCASQGVQYIRIACTDLVCPEEEQVDEFMEAYKALPEGTWLHFHCAAGVGRTGIFMMMADMVRNPDVPLEDIISRQVLLGASDPRKTDSEENVWKVSLLNHFHDYIEECWPEGYQVSYSEWASQQDW